MTQIIAG